MTTRTIPSDVQPVWSCTVNGKKYRFPSGATVDVPDDVAALIDNINAGKEHPPAPYVPTLPAIGDGDEGKVIMVNGKRYVLAEAGGGGSVTVDDELSDSSTNPVQNKVIKAALDANKPFIVTLTEDDQENITADKTHAQIKTAFDAGREVVLFKDGDTRLRVQMVNAESVISEMINVFANTVVFGMWYESTDGEWTEHTEIRSIEADNG